MGRRPKWGRPVDGLLILNKPSGVSSNHALQTVKRLCFAKRAGHTGALDPLATGMLPICLGEATKFSQFLLDTDKRYITEATFGISTDSGDSDGSIIDQQDSSTLTAKMVTDAMPSLIGDIQQVPSMYSALKHQGKPLYEYAREGQNIDRAARKITIFQFEMLSFEPGIKPTAKFSVHCSKGTYVRSLIEDLGKLLAVGAHVSQLHRQQVGHLTEDLMIDQETLASFANDHGRIEETILQSLLLPVDSLVNRLPEIILNSEQHHAFSRGIKIPMVSISQLSEIVSPKLVFRVYGSQQFLGIGYVNEERLLCPKRLISSLP